MLKCGRQRGREGVAVNGKVGTGRLAKSFSSLDRSNDVERRLTPMCTWKKVGSLGNNALPRYGDILVRKACDVVSGGVGTDLATRRRNPTSIREWGIISRVKDRF